MHIYKYMRFKFSSYVFVANATECYLHHSHSWVDLRWQRYMNLIFISVNSEQEDNITQLYSLCCSHQIAQIQRTTLRKL